MDLSNVDKNVLAKIALELDVSDLMKLCLTNKKFNSVCGNEDFWLKKLMIDMPGYKDYKEISNSKTFKEAYEKLSLTEINLLVTLNGLGYGDEDEKEDEDDERYVQIHVEYDLVFKFVPIWEIEKKIKKIVKDYIQTKGLFGRYTIEVDGKEVVNYSKSMKGLNLTYGKHNVSIFFDVVVGDRLEEDVEEESQLLFEQIIREHFIEK